MGKGKKSSNKKASSTKLSAADRADVTQLVDQLIKECVKVPIHTSFSSKQECENFEQIYNIVEKIRDLEKGLDLPRYDRDEQLKDFSAWALQKGIKWSKVQPEQCGSAGYGLVCQEALGEGETVMEVPVSAMMTERCCADTYIGTLIARDPLLHEMGNVRLALHVLVEYLNPASKWLPYVRSLPSSYETPLHCTPRHIDQLRCSPVLEAVVKQYRNIGRQYAYLYRVLHRLPEARNWPLKEHFTYDAYRWAVCCVCTRINSVPSSKGGTQLALVPCWDLVNHDNGPMSTDFVDAEQKLVCYANRSFSAGEQFTIHYGNRGNADLFLHSGFVDKGNPHDSVTLRLGLSRSDPLLEVKQRALAAVGLDAVKEFAVVAGDRPVSPQLWAYAVIFSAQQDYLTTLLDSATPSALVAEAEGATRATAARFLHTRVSLLLRGYAAAVQQCPDQESPDPLSALIASLLLCERELLLAAQLFLSASLPAGP